MEPTDIVGKSKEDVSLPKGPTGKLLCVTLDRKAFRLSYLPRLMNSLKEGGMDESSGAPPIPDASNSQVESGGGIVHGDLVTWKATMFKIIKEMLPPDVRVARDAQDLLVECCVEFINLVSSESNEVCSKEEKRTIAPEHVLKALEVLGFGDYIEEVYAAYEQHRLETLDSPKGGKWSGGGGAEMTEEEALAEQQRMFAEARARMNNGPIIPKRSDSDRSLDS